MKNFGTFLCCKHLSSFLSWNVVVLSLESLSTSSASHDDILGRCVKCKTLPKYAAIKCRPLIRTEAHLSPATDLFSHPKIHAVLSTFITMCWPFSFSGINRNGSTTPTSSSVVVLFLNFAPLLTLFSNKPLSGQNSCFANIISPFSENPTVPEPILPFQEDPPAASDENSFLNGWRPTRPWRYWAPFLLV